MVLEDSDLASFPSMFRRRFAALFGRKIARQRAEQYIGGLLAARASRRNVTSLATTVDGATARSLGWLLNKSPWATQTVVDAAQTYVAEEIGSEHGVFALSLASFVKRGDNAVGVTRQYVAHLGRTLNCQIGIFLAYGSDGGSALVDAALYLPQSWTDDPARRRRAGIPEDVGYASHTDLAIDLLRRTRAASHLHGHWVTVHHSASFEADLRQRLAEDGWWYLVPTSPETTVLTSPDDPAPRPIADLLPEPGSPLCVRRVWEHGETGPGVGLWLITSPDPETGTISLFVSNAPEMVTPEEIERVLATHWPAAACDAQRETTSLDVYRVRGWDGWHKHVTLALLASAFRACLSFEPTGAAELPAEPIALRPEDRAADDAAVSAPTGPTTYRLQVAIAETDWRAVRALQVLLAADEVGEVLQSVPSRADVERQEVTARMDLTLSCTQGREQLLAALAEVPEIEIVELVAETDASASLDAEPTTTEILEHPEDFLAALEAELAERTVARKADLAAPIETAANHVASIFETVQQQIGHEAAPRDLTGAGSDETTGINGTNGSHGADGGANGGSHPAHGSLLAPLEHPVTPPDESPARIAPTERSSGTAADAPAARITEEQLVVLDVADEAYGIPVQRVREIIRVPPITRVPNGPAFLEGVINLRGQVIPVLDLRKHLGLPASDHSRRSRVVVAELGDYAVGMVVDGVSQVVMVPTGDIEPPPTLVAGAEDGQVRGVARLGDRLVLLLEPDRMLPKR